MGGLHRILVRINPGQVSAPLWAALRAAEEPRSIRELHVASRAHPQAIHLRLGRWVRAGLVIDHGGKPRRYTMSDQAPDHVHPPRVGPSANLLPLRTARDRMWSSIRVLRQFDLPTLLIAAEVTRRSAEDFINCLLRAGYLARAHRGNTMRADWSVYRLVRRSGPKTPVVSHGCAEGVRWRRVADPNDGALYDISPRPRPPAVTQDPPSVASPAPEPLFREQVR